MTTADSTARELSRIGRDLVAMSTHGDQLATIAQAQADLDVLRGNVVAQLRMAGQSWQTIADQLGVTKQAALKRYGDLAAQVERREMRAMRDSYRQSAGQAATEVAAVEQLPAAVVGQVHPSLTDAEVDQLDVDHRCCQRCQRFYDDRAMWVVARNPICYVCQLDLAGVTDRALDLDAPELLAARASWLATAGPCSCPGTADELDTFVDVDPVGPHAVPCSECGVEPGEPCRIGSCGHYTRHHRPHAARTRLAASAS